MNVYEKLQEARVKLAQCNLKKSGKNSFSGYDYFELSDFLPRTMEIFKELKLASIVSFNSLEATLTIVNVEKSDEQIVITSPFSSANLKGCHEVQNLGAVQTYLRRYLYVAALEITDADVINKTHNPNEKVEPSKPSMVPCDGCGSSIQRNVAEFSWKKFGKKLCRNCQTKG